MKRYIRKYLPGFYNLLYRFKKQPDDLSAMLFFLLLRGKPLNIFKRVQIIYGICRISASVKCPHTEVEILTIMEGILSCSKEKEGCIVEAGCFKGGSTAKLSLIARILNRQLIVFDSFEGIPENDELNPGGSYHHPPGAWCGTLDEVKSNIKKYGCIEVCNFHKGLFSNTMKSFNHPIITAFCDVDLASSVKDCLRYLYPQIVTKGLFYSQDGHLEPVIDVFKDEVFWINDVKSKIPEIKGIGEQKLLMIEKN